MLKPLVTKQILFHFVLVLLLATTMASHSRGLWPGDDWYARAAYFICRFSLETIIFLGAYYLITVIPAKLNTWLRLFIAFLISWPIFVLAITMIDIVLGQPELNGALYGDKSRLISEIVDELFWILPKHISFCCLVALINFRLEYQELFNFLFNLNTTSSKELKTLKHQSREKTLISILSSKIQEAPLRVQAQEHYIDITTCLGSELVLYRFGQALLDLQDVPGLQVHRSYWVAKENVLGWIKNNTNLVLKLKFGESVPVSRRFEQIVQNEFQRLQQKEAL